MKTTRTSVADNGACPAPVKTFDRAAGARARTRREELPLTRNALAAVTGLNTSNIVRWESRGIPTCLPTSKVQAWEKALQVPDGWLFEAGAAEAEALAEGDLFAAAGRRARERREALRLTRRAIAARAGVTVAVLGYWERYGAPPAIKPAQVAAWERALEVKAGWLLGTTATADSPPTGDEVCGDTLSWARGIVAPAASQAAGTPLVSDAPDARSAILDLGERIAAIRFEKLARSEKRAEREAMSARIFSRRYGVDASGGTALAAIGRHYGVVESRVSQILKDLKTTAEGLSIIARVFERIREHAAPLLPALPADLERHLRELLGSGMSVEDAARFSLDVLGEPLFVFEKRSFNGRSQSVATAPGAGDAVLEFPLPQLPITEAAGSMIRVVGAAHMGMLKTYAAEEGWADDAIAKIQPVLEQLDGFEWLETPMAGKPQWFWLRGFAGHLNLVIEATRRVLAVSAGVVTFDDVLGGIARLRASRVRHGGFPPMFDIQAPPRIMLSLIQRQPWLAATTQESGVRALQPIDPAEVLAPTELIVYEALRAAGGVAPRALLFRNLVDNGVLDRETLRSWLNFSPFIARPFRAVYALRGVKIDPHVFAEALRETPGLNSALWPIEVSKDGAHVTFHQILSAWDLRSWTVLPAGLVAHVPLCSFAVGHEEGSVEVVTATHGAVKLRGLARILRARALQVGDVIKLSLDVRARTLSIDRLPQGLGADTLEIDDID